MRLVSRLGSIALLMALATGAFAQSGARADSAVLSGVVMADSTGAPIRGADVAVVELAKSTLTDERGAFRIAGIPAGNYRVQVRHLGHSPAEAFISFAPGQTVEQRFTLKRAVLLDSVSVTAERRSPLLVEFDENRRLGLGHFLTRAEIAKKEGLQMSALLEQMPGLKLMYANGGSTAWILSPIAPSSFGGTNVYIPEDFERMRGMKEACYAQVYLDAALMNPPVTVTAQQGRGNAGSAAGARRATPPFDVNSIPPTQIEAVEFYATPAQTPLRYARLNSSCGVLVIHTRR